MTASSFAVDRDVREEDPHQRLAARFSTVRQQTEALAAPLSPEDQVIQSMADASPTKWHRGHTTWFFEEFVLAGALADYDRVDPSYQYLFNSYYEAVGARQPRPRRGMITRPSVDDVAAYRRSVDEAVGTLFAPGRDALTPAIATLIELGTHHEQQHQELLLMDIKHALYQNPLRPTYEPAANVSQAPGSPRPLSFTRHSGGLVEIGHQGDGFSFDNEGPRHKVWLEPFGLADRLVTCGEWLDFMADDGYSRPDLWLSDGWAAVGANEWQAPLYWDQVSGEWSIFTLSGPRPIRADEPVVHVSYYEADAFARWAGHRLPLEAEWEIAAEQTDVDSAPFTLHPQANGLGQPGQLFGEVWQWTASPYSAYPGFCPAPGAVGEYNGKFMVDQHVLRGSACVTPTGHARATYRNFFPSPARWAFSGLRLATDA